MKKIVFVFSGPSGTGKSTLIRHVLKKFKNSGSTVSCTTRQKRFGEKDGVDYHFISHEKFESLIKNGEFVEHVECYGNKYGTLKSSIYEIIKENDICILDMDFEGAHNILSNKIIDYDCLGILILPPSMKTLKNRLVNRKSETEDSIYTRLSESFQPKKIANYEYIIINKYISESKKNITYIFEKHSNDQLT